MKPDAIRLAEIQEMATWTHQEMDEAAAELRAQDAVIQRLIKIIGQTPHYSQHTLEIALNALKSIDAETPYPIAKHAIKCINAAFNTQAQPEQDKRPDYCGSGHCSCIECPYGMDQEPIGYADVCDLEDEGMDFYVNRQRGKRAVPVYLAPPSKPWQSLTDDEAYQLLVDYCDDDLGLLNAIEAALRSKNNG